MKQAMLGSSMPTQYYYSEDSNPCLDVVHSDAETHYRWLLYEKASARFRSVEGETRLYLDWLYSALAPEQPKADEQEKLLLLISPPRSAPRASLTRPLPPLLIPAESVSRPGSPQDTVQASVTKAEDTPSPRASEPALLSPTGSASKLPPLLLSSPQKQHRNSKVVGGIVVPVDGRTLRGDEALKSNVLANCGQQRGAMPFGNRRRMVFRKLVESEYFNSAALKEYKAAQAAQARTDRAAGVTQKVPEFLQRPNHTRMTVRLVQG